MGTYLSPNAGYILNVGHGSPPGRLDGDERRLLQELARRVREVADLPRQAETRELWYAHNALRPARPMLLLFPEDSWAEVLPESTLAVSDPFWRQWEWYLRHLLLRHESFLDDFVIEATLWVPKVVIQTGWGLAPTYRWPEQVRGSCVWEAPLRERGDLARLTAPSVWVDTEATASRLDALREVLGEWLDVREHCALPHANMIGEATQLRGLAQVLVDMLDDPPFLHDLMDFIARGIVGIAETLESGGHLTLNNGHHYNDSGGIGYTRELPSEDFDSRHVRMKDLWGFGVAQEADGVGPVQHEEFILQYQLRLLERCGLNAYGCCEPYTHKFEMLRRVPRLRRVSVSPWCDLARAAEALGDRAVLSWKPNPALLVGRVDAERIRRAVREAIAMARGCALEIVLKDTFTLEGQPERIELFGRIAREEIGRSGVGP